MLDERAWVAVAFAVFVGLAYRPVSKMLATALDKRAALIEKELAEATRLREEAQAMLESYQKKHHQVTVEAEEILRHARDEARRMQLQAQEDIKRAVEVRIAQADQKIAHEEQKAIQDVQRQVVDVAIEAAKSVIVENLHVEADETLIRLAVKDIHRVVH